MTAEISKLPGSKIPLLASIIESLIDTFTEEIMRSTLLFVYFSHGGIFEHELQYLVSQDVERMKRWGKAARSHRLAEVQIASLGAAASGMTENEMKLDSFSFSLLYQRLKVLLPISSSGLLQFFHNDMRTLIFLRFLDDNKREDGDASSLTWDRREFQLGEANIQKQFELQSRREVRESLQYNRILAEYYLKQVEEQGNYELRTLHSLTTHMVKANMMVELREFLLFPLVFKVMFSSDLRNEFISLWKRCLSWAKPAEATPTLHPIDHGDEPQDDDDLHVTQIFRDIDLNDNGAISAHEFGKFFRKAGHDFLTVSAEFEEIDTDGNGAISLPEFLAYCRSKRESLSRKEYERFLPMAGQEKASLMSHEQGSSKNLGDWYRESLASESNVIDDPIEEAEVFCLMGDFFLLNLEDSQGLELDKSEAESFYNQALVLNPKATTALIGLSRLEREQNKLDRAKDNLRSAIGYLQSTFGYRHIEVARAQREMAQVCEMQNDFQTARQVMSKARKIVAETSGKQSVEYSEFCMSEGDLLVSIAEKSFNCSEKNQLIRSKYLMDSIAAYREAIEKQKHVLGEKHPLVLKTYDRSVGIILDHPEVLTDSIVEEFGKPRLDIEQCIFGALQSNRAFELLHMLVQLDLARQEQTKPLDECSDAAMASSQWYLHVAFEARKPKMLVQQPAEVIDVAKASRALAVRIKPLYATGLALQVRPGTDALELAEVDDNDNQLWLWHGEEVQNVGNGLFLQADVRYMCASEVGGAIWDSSGVPLAVRPRSNCDRQRWIVDKNPFRKDVRCKFLQMNIADLTPDRHKTLLKNCSTVSRVLLAKSIYDITQANTGVGEVGLETKQIAAIMRDQNLSGVEKQRRAQAICAQKIEDLRGMASDDDLARHREDCRKAAADEAAMKKDRAELIEEYVRLVNRKDGVLIRHAVGGQVLDINFMHVIAGSGVNINAPTSIAIEGQAWVLESWSQACPSINCKQKTEVDDTDQAVQGELVARSVADHSNQTDLDDTLQALDAAQTALRNLSKVDVAELKALACPPKLLQATMEAVCTLKGIRPDWDTAKRLFNRDFIGELINFDIDSIDLERIDTVCENHMKKAEFTPEHAGKVSNMAKVLCLWVRAIVDYARVAPGYLAKRRVQQQTHEAETQQEAQEKLCLLESARKLEVILESSRSDIDREGLKIIFSESSRSQIDRFMNFVDPSGEHAPHDVVDVILALKGHVQESNNWEADRARATMEADAVAERLSDLEADCERGLAAAMPVLEKADKALQVLNKRSISELKALARPPAGVQDVTDAILALKGTPMKNRGWKAAKSMMQDASFIDDLQALKGLIDDSKLPAKNVEDARLYLAAEHMDPSIMGAKSLAASCLCDFLRNIVAYYDGVAAVQPKRKALAQAQVDLKTAKTNLDEVRTRAADHSQGGGVQLAVTRWSRNVDEFLETELRDLKELVDGGALSGKDVQIIQGRVYFKTLPDMWKNLRRKKAEPRDRAAAGLYYYLHVLFAYYDVQKRIKAAAKDEAAEQQAAKLPPLHLCVADLNETLKALVPFIQL